MRKIRWFLTLSFVSIFSTIQFCSNKKSEEPLAVVNGDIISLQDFGKRLDFFTRITGIKDNLQTREDLLNQMINEQLLIQEFHRRGWDKTPDFKRKAASIRDQYYLDTFRKKMFFDTVSVNEQEIAARFRFYKQKVAARHLYARTREQAEQLYQRVKNGESFESLAKVVFQDPRLAENGGYLGYFGKDEMDPAFEKAAFTMKVGEISPPVKTQFGYSIIKLEDRIVIPVASESEFIDAKPRLEKEIRIEKSIQYAQRLGHKLASDLKAKFNEDLIKFVFAKMRDARKNQMKNPEIENETLDVALKNVAHEKLVKFKFDEWTIEEFLEQAKRTSIRQQQRIESEEDLKQFILGLRVRQEILKLAAKTDIPDDEKLQKEIAHAIDGAKVGAMLQAIGDSVTVPTEALREEYEKNRDGYFVQEQANVREILVGEKSAAEKLLKRIRKGESFFELAKKYSLRRWAAAKGGELGFAPRSQFGVLADSIFDLRPGEIAGPFSVEGFYAIVQMIDKKPARQKTFDEAKQEIASNLLWKWRQIRLHNFVEQLRQHAEIEIDHDKLRWTVFEKGKVIKQKSAKSNANQ